MATGDPITDQQISFIDTMARECLIDYEGADTLDDYVEPVYGCKFFELNRGQASMLIEDMKFEMGKSSVKPDWQSIFPDR